MKNYILSFAVLLIFNIILLGQTSQSKIVIDKSLSSISKEYGLGGLLFSTEDGKGGYFEGWWNKNGSYIIPIVR